MGRLGIKGIWCLGKISGRLGLSRGVMAVVVGWGIIGGMFCLIKLIVLLSRMIILYYVRVLIPIYGIIYLHLCLNFIYKVIKI